MIALLLCDQAPACGVPRDHAQSFRDLFSQADPCWIRKALCNFVDPHDGNVSWSAARRPGGDHRPAPLIWRPCESAFRSGLRAWLSPSSARVDRAAVAAVAASASTCRAQDPRAERVPLRAAARFRKSDATFRFSAAPARTRV